MNLYMCPLFRVNRWVTNLFSFSALILSVSFLLTLLSSCNSNNEFSPNWSSETVDKTIAVNVLQDGGVYGLNDNSSDFESKLSTMYVLVFLPRDNAGGLDDSDNLLFYNMAHVSNLNYSQIKKATDFNLKVNVPHDSQRVKLVFVANPKRLDVEGFKNKTLTDISSEIEFKAFNQATYIWDMTKQSTLDSESLPISAALDMNVADFEKLKSVDISLCRAVARVDIGFNYSVNSDGSEVQPDNANIFDGKAYLINSIYVYRITENGLVVAPEAERLNISNSPKVSNVPYVVKLAKATANPVKRMIYLPENKGARSIDGDETVTTFVVGVYNEGFQGVDKTRYYKVNRSKIIDGELSYESLSRNKRIVIGINEIIGDGYRTPDEALKGEADLNTTITVVDWIEEDIEVGGQGGYPGFKWKDDALNADTEHYHRLSDFDLGASSVVVKEIYIYGGAIPKSFETDKFKLFVEEVLDSTEENLWKITVSAIDRSILFSVKDFLEFDNHRVPLYIYQNMKSLRPEKVAGGR